MAHLSRKTGPDPGRGGQGWVPKSDFFRLLYEAIRSTGYTVRLAFLIVVSMLCVYGLLMVLSHALGVRELPQGLGSVVIKPLALVCVSAILTYATSMGYRSWRGDRKVPRRAKRAMTSTDALLKPDPPEQLARVWDRTPDRGM